MIFTARQLEELHRSNGHVTLPYRARLTPLAQDWVRQKKIVIGYADVEIKKPSPAENAAAADATAISRPFLWWCDGPCGPSKAALMAQAKESNLAELGIATDAAHLVPAIKKIADEVKLDRSAGGILLVQHGAGAMVYANRCPSLRAVLGTCLEAVEQGVQQVAANVLVIEYSYPGTPGLSQVKNLLSRFVRGKRELSDEVKARLKELATCG